MRESGLKAVTSCHLGTTLCKTSDVQGFFGWMFAQLAVRVGAPLLKMMEHQQQPITIAATNSSQHTSRDRRDRSTPEQNIRWNRGRHDKPETNLCSA